MFFIRIVIILIITILSIPYALAVGENTLNVRNSNIGSTGNDVPILEKFISPIRDLFFAPGGSGGGAVMNAFVEIAFNIKNFFILLAVIFLIIGVMKLLFSSADEEATKKWRANIIWVSVGIFVMQIAFAAWNTLLLSDPSARIGSMAGWQIWVNIFSPIVGLLQILAGLGFLGMMIYAFYVIVAGG
jgi:hypothetical protein